MSDAIVPKGQPIPGDPEKKGWLFKWTNYLKGYQRRWFVLSNGLLSYYRNQAEMTHTCRGTISLLGALIHTADSCTFVISNGGTQTFHIKAHDEVERQSWVTALELAKARAMLVLDGRAQESDDDDDLKSGVSSGGGEMDSEDAGGMARELSARFHDLRTCSELVARHGAALQRSLVDLEIPPSDTTKQVSERATLFRISCNAMMNACSEFMSAASASSARMSRLLQHEREQKLRLQEVVEQLARQHDTLENTVKGRTTLPLLPSGQGTGQGNETEDEEHEFFDAVEVNTATATEDKTGFTMKVPVNNIKKGEGSDSDGETVTETQQLHFVEGKGTETAVAATDATVVAATALASTAASAATAETTSTATAEKLTTATAEEAATAGASKAPDEPLPKIWPHVSLVKTSLVDGHPRRTRIPDKPNLPLSLWAILKNCIGKELTKIPIPVNFSEPLSMLQRLAEDYEYSFVLDQAAQFEDPAQQLAYVAAFTVSSYATTASRTNKPFNPLLGETYECDRTSDLGWRVISEQVSHHPPMVAQFCEGTSGWECWQEFTMTSKFRGKYLQIIPLGVASVKFPKTGSKYSWRKVLHHPPTMACYSEGLAGWTEWRTIAISSFFRGHVVVVLPKGDVTTTVHNIIVGKLWVDNHGDMEIRGEEGPCAGYVAHVKYLPYSYFSKETNRKVTGVIKDPHGVPRYVLQGYWDTRVEVAPVMSASPDNTQGVTGKFTTAWERFPPPPDSEKYYNFTVLAAQLNEPESGVAPTDSRNRPDQRLMEEGDWDGANEEKLRLEEKQRTARRELEAATAEAAARGLPPPEPPRPVWFKREAEPAASHRDEPSLRHLYTHKYWECKARQDWSACPSIF